jgi:hypothetical protein
MGWKPGRQITGQVDQWLASDLPTFTDDAFRRDGFPIYRPSEAARRVLDEFGGLCFQGGSKGISMAPASFWIYPVPEPAVVPPHLKPNFQNLTTFMFSVQLLGRRLGKQLFQVGEIERVAALVVAEDGMVYTTGVDDMLLGVTPEEALNNMILGVRVKSL